MLIRVTRRQLGIALITIVGSAAFWTLSRYGRDAIEIDLPLPGNPFNPTYEIFHALSQIVLARSNLDEPTAKKMYAIFMDEPWGAKHIGHAYTALHAMLAAAPRARQDGPDLKSVALGPGERWFVEHLVTTWYLGIYYHEERPVQRVTLQHALMYEAAKGLLPVPYFENVGFGGWEEAPSAEANAYR